MDWLKDAVEWVRDNPALISVVVTGLLSALGLKKTRQVAKLDDMIDRWWVVVENGARVAGWEAGEKWTRFIKGLWDDFADEHHRDPTGKEYEYIRKRAEKLCANDKRCKNGLQLGGLPSWVLEAKPPPPRRR